MEVAEHILKDEAKLFVGEDMVEGCLVDAGSGSVAVYSSPSPGKDSPNEDTAALIPYGDSQLVLAVADGLGGAPAGQRASSLAVDELKGAIGQGLGEDRGLRGSIMNGFERANQAVLDLGIGAATTLAVVEIQENKVRPYHAGDSLILVVGQRGKLKTQSVPHSPVGYGVESGLLDEREAMYHEERHIVSNVIGSPDMRIEVGPTLDLAPRDTLLIASDGLWDNLHTEEIVETVRKGPLGRAVRALADRCDRRMREGGDHAPSKPDDLTFILFRLRLPRRKGG